MCSLGRVRVVLLSLSLLIITSIGLLPQFYQAYDDSMCVLASRNIYLLAVSQDSSGRYIGVATRATVYLTRGEGDIYISISPAAQIDMQSSLSVGVLLASYISGRDISSYNFLVKIVSDTPIIGGPSASGFLTIAVLSLLLNQTLPTDIVMTGMIMPDGSIGPVGGIPEKLQAAKTVNATIMIIPFGQRISTDLNTGAQVDVVDMGARLGVRVVEVRNIYDAARVFGINVIEPKPLNLSIDPEFNSLMREWVLNLSSMNDALLRVVNRTIDQMPSLLRNTLSNYYTSALSDLSRAREEYLSGDYYSSASDYFSSNIKLDMIRWTITIYNNPSSYQELYRDVVGNFSKVANLYRDLVEKVVKRGFVSISEISILNEIAYRVYDANKTIMTLPSSATRILNLNTIYNAVYSLWRIQSIYNWIYIYDNLKSKGDLVKIDLLRRTSVLLANFLQNTFVYLSSLGVINPTISSIESMISDIYYYSSLGDIVMMNSLAIQASALATALMHQLFTTNITATASIVRDLAVRYSSDVFSRGNDVSIPLMYIARGDSISNIDPVSSMYFYELAIMNTLWYRILERSLASAQVTQQTSTPYTTTTQSITTHTSITSSQTPLQIKPSSISSYVSLTLLIPVVFTVVAIILIIALKRVRRSTTRSTT